MAFGDSDWLPEALRRVVRETPALREAFFVGGCVRDRLLGISNKDFDIEAFGVSYERLAGELGRWGRTDLVGRSFGVVKLTTRAGETFDFSIPRRDSKVAPGHKGFEIAFDPSLTPREAAARRDFTINSLMYDPRRDEVLDFFGGRQDLEDRVLRHTSAAFVEDPLRVLRGMQFAGRFNLRPAPETVALCRGIKAGCSELALERVRDEWFKWAEKSAVPSAGLRFLEATEWLEHFPEVNALRGVSQDPEWHPEGDVFTHTCHCLDALVNLAAWREADVESRIVYSLAVLAHDFAKPQTTHEAIKEGRPRIVSPGHEEAGGPLAEQFLERIHAPLAVRERVVPLVTNHLAHLQAISDRAVRRLARRLAPENIAGLVVVITADQFGRPPKPRVVSDGVRELEARAGALQVQVAAPRAIVMGRHLIPLGLTPGPAFGEILDAAYEAQLEGHFFDLAAGLRWLAEQAPLPFTAEQRRRMTNDE